MQSSGALIKWDEEKIQSSWLKASHVQHFHISILHIQQPQAHPNQFHLMLQLGMAQQQNTPTLDTLDGSI